MSVGMADVVSRFGTTISTVKMVLLCVGIMSIIVFLKVAVIPYASSTVASAVSSVPAIATCFRTWLSPPYIYIILNFIILTIAAQNHLPVTTGEFRMKETAEKEHDPAEETVLGRDRTTSREEKEQPAEETGETMMNVEAAEEEGRNEEGEEEEEASLEETWVKIMEAQGKGQRRQLKKSETWDTPPRVVVAEDDDDDPGKWARRELSKSATFKETAAAGAARREKSMDQEELNRRAEAFIMKFKLQRLESHQRVLNHHLINAA